MNKDSKSVDYRNSCINRDKVNDSIKRGVIDQDAYYNLDELQKVDPDFVQRYRSKIAVLSDKRNWK